MTYPRKVLGFWVHRTEPDPITNLRGYGIYRPGFCSIGFRRWDGVFWVSLFGRTILQTKPINGTSR